jgi:hypothetical protein
MRFDRFPPASLIKATALSGSEILLSFRAEADRTVVGSVAGVVWSRFQGKRLAPLLFFFFFPFPLFFYSDLIISGYFLMKKLKLLRGNFNIEMISCFNRFN